MKKILIIGGSGMIASRFIDMSSSEFEIVPVDEKTLDITDGKAVGKYFEDNVGFDSIINFAAYTNVDGAESQKGDESGLVWKLNVEGPKNLIEASIRHNIFLVQISTDFVFPGNENNPGPYDEEHELPENSEGIGWYGWTKNRAEAELIKSKARYAIVRFGYPFRADKYEVKKDWARNLINMYSEGNLYPLFDDQTQNILFIDDLVIPLSKIIKENLPGVFHIASKDTTTPYESGKYLLQEYTGGVVDIKKGSMAEFLKTPGRTPRPRLGGFTVEKTEGKLGIKLRTWREMIDEFINQTKS